MLSVGVNSVDRSGESSLPLPPRGTVRRWGVPIPLKIVLCALIPHVWVGVGIIVALVVPAMVAGFGDVVQGRVMAQSLTSGKGTHYLIQYAYEDRGRKYTDMATVSENAGRGLAPGTAVKVTTLHRWKIDRSRIDGAEAPMGSWVGMIVFALFWNGIVFTALAFVIVEPLRHRWLVRYGQAAGGRITGEKIRTGKSTTYTALFEYTTADGRHCTGEMDITKRQHNQFRPGPVTVLYDPSGWRKSLIYELCRYRALAVADTTGGVVWTKPR